MLKLRQIHENDSIALALSMRLGQLSETRHRKGVGRLLKTQGFSNDTINSDYVAFME